MRNKKLYIAMLVLVVVFLAGMYVLKIFFPQEFVLAIENETIIKIGTYIDSHKWLYYICCGITSFVTYWLYVCAVSHRLKLKWYECLYILATVVGLILLSIYNTTLYTVLNWCSFAFLPSLCKGDMKTCGFVLTTHALSQVLSLSIRNLPMYFTNSLNTVTTFVMTFECFLWLVLMYVIFNFKKENK